MKKTKAIVERDKELREAKAAAQECLDALDAILDVSQRFPSKTSPHGVIKMGRVDLIMPFDEVERPVADVDLEDYGPYIVRLYSAVRNGWVPICRLWPRLIELMAYAEINSRPIDDNTVYYLDDNEIDEPAPVAAWSLALNILCAWVEDSASNTAAEAAMAKWSQSVSLEVNANPISRWRVWSKMWNNLAVFGYVSPGWRSMPAAIEKAIPTVPLYAREWVEIPPYPSGQPWPQPLPNRRSVLIWLLKRLNRFVDHVHAVIEKRRRTLSALKYLFMEDGPARVRDGKRQASETAAEQAEAKQVARAESLLDELEGELPEIPTECRMYVSTLDYERLSYDLMEPSEILRCLVIDRRKKWENSKRFSLARGSKKFATAFTPMMHEFRRIEAFWHQERDRVLHKLTEVRDANTRAGNKQSGMASGEGGNAGVTDKDVKPPVIEERTAGPTSKRDEDKHQRPAFSEPMPGDETDSGQRQDAGQGGGAPLGLKELEATPGGPDAEKTVSPYFSSQDLAKKYRVPDEALRKRLDRWRIGNRGEKGSGFRDASADRRRGEPQWLYREAAVLHIITNLQKDQQTEG